MLVLGALNLDSCVLTQGNSQWQRHGADKPVRVHKALARPLGNEEAPEKDESTVHPAE